MREANTVFPKSPTWPGEGTSRVPFWAYTREVLEGREIECPLHQGKFDVCTGQALCAPLTEGIKTYAVRIENMRVRLKLD